MIQKARASMQTAQGIDLFFRFGVALFIVLLGGAPGLRRAILPGYLLMMLTGIVLAMLI
jgi:hypothetical protein